MKGQKASRLDAVETHLKMQKQILEQLFNELQHVKNLAITTLETFKAMPGYDQAVEDFKAKLAEVEEGPKMVSDE